MEVISLATLFSHVRYFAVFDAAGKPGPGLTQGNLLMMGGYDMCLSIKNATSGYYNFCYVGAPGKLFVSLILPSQY